MESGVKPATGMLRACSNEKGIDIVVGVWQHRSRSVSDLRVSFSYCWQAMYEEEKFSSGNQS